MMTASFPTKLRAFWSGRIAILVRILTSAHFVGGLSTAFVDNPLLCGAGVSSFPDSLFSFSLYASLLLLMMCILLSTSRDSARIFCVLSLLHDPRELSTQNVDKFSTSSLQPSLADSIKMHSNSSMRKRLQRRQELIPMCGKLFHMRLPIAPITYLYDILALR
jgi:hypothetical protein